MKKILIFTLKFYKGSVSPLLRTTFGEACRFTPTCSEYMVSALEKYGVRKGLFMGIKRLGRCHPFGGFGFDPV